MIGMKSKHRIMFVIVNSNSFGITGSWQTLRLRRCAAMTIELCWRAFCRDTETKGDKENADEVEEEEEEEAQELEEKPVTPPPAQ